jgi:ribose transport system substrate-binding protein
VTPILESAEISRCASGPPLQVRAAAGQPALVTSIRSLSNPYHAVWKVGADAFGKAVGTPNTTLVTEANSEKGISDIRAMIAKTGGNMVLNVDPNNTPDARPIVEACFKAKVYVVTRWNKPADLHPWDFDPYYISHIEFDGAPTALTSLTSCSRPWATKAASSLSGE